MKSIPQSMCCRVVVDLAHQCSSKVSVGPEVRCPLGTETLGELCFLHELTSPIEGCPRGSKATRGGCLADQGKGLMPMSKDCPPGFSFRDKGACERRSTVPQEMVCAPGFTLSGSMCTATDFLPPQPVCPEGSESNVDGICIARETYLPSILCPDEYSLDNLSNLCVGETSAAKLPACPIGAFDAAEDACVFAELLPAEVACPPAAETIIGDNGSLICEEKKSVAPLITCPPDFNLSDTPNQMCLGRALADGELTCISPYTDDGETCLFSEVLPKTMGCIDGGFLKGTSCIAPEKQQPLIVCPESYAYNQQSQLCRKLLWSKPVPICPEGMVYDNLVQKCYLFARPNNSGSSTPRPTNESVLPLQVQPGQSGSSTTTTTTKPPVKAKVQQPSSGKEQFIPIQTFTGPEALKQASNMETLKLANQASGVNPPKPVYVPPTTN